MCKVKINLDSYKEFFSSENGLKLITEIVENGDYDAVKDLVKWKQCTSEVLDKIATKFMSLGISEGNLAILEDVAKHPRVSVKTHARLFEFVINFLDRYYGATNVLIEISEHKKLIEELAWNLYNLAVQEELLRVINGLAENSKTPDKILFAILDNYEEKTEQYRKACAQIAERYRKNMK